MPDHPEARFRAVACRLEPVLFFGLLALMAAMLLALGPVLTSDGPAHVSIAHFLRHAGDPAFSQLNRLLEANPVPTPNAFGHLMLAGLIFVLTPLQAEMALQAACLLGIPLAARLVLRQIAPEAAWLALFFFPVALQKLFYLGLYNFSLSVVGFLLSLWAWLRLREQPGAGRTMVLSAMLLLTLACQASGWIEALAAMLAMLTVEALAAVHAGTGQQDMRRLAGTTAVAALPSLALFMVFAAKAGGDAPMVYGAPPIERVLGVLLAEPFATVGSIAHAAGLGATLALLGLVAAGAAGLWRRWRRGDAVGTLPVALCAVPLALLALMLVVPDRAAGGWTHVARSQLFPYVGLALLAAALPVAGWLRHGAMAMAAGCGLAVIGVAAWLQATQVPPVVARFAEADALVGPHCTVVPVLGHYKLDRANTARVIHHPAFHLAHRMQWHGDRPVLFSYAARLAIYPARFRPGLDPQLLLYGWEPLQGDTMVRALDVQRWEETTGIQVDYVLLWDVLPDAAPGPHQGLRSAVLTKYGLVHRSADGRLELYRRGGSGTGACALPG